MKILDNIDEISTKQEMVLYSIDENNIQDYIKDIELILTNFTKVLTGFIEFEKLTYTITMFMCKIDNVDFSSYDQKTRYQLYRLFYSIVDDISHWLQDTFINQDLDDVLYINKTIASSCMQIESIVAFKN